MALTGAFDCDPIKRPVELLSCGQTLSRPVGMEVGGAKETEEEAVAKYMYTQRKHCAWKTTCLVSMSV